MTADPADGYVTECPSCHTRFRVSHPQLERARGRVRCGACLAVFDGLDHLVLDAFGSVSEDHARQALDDLLDELAADAPAQEGIAEVPAIGRSDAAIMFPPKGSANLSALHFGTISGAVRLLLVDTNAL
jgi:predicted Zn finger-like uncharacterized protein